MEALIFLAVLVLAAVFAGKGSPNVDAGDYGTAVDDDNLFETFDEDMMGVDGLCNSTVPGWNGD